MLVVVLLAFGYYYKTQREDSQGDRKAFTEALGKHNEALGIQSTAIGKAVDKIDQMDRRIELQGRTIDDMKLDLRDVKGGVDRLEATSLRRTVRTTTSGVQ